MVLPAKVGGRTSLNLFVAPVGPSGVGKDAADAAAQEAICFDCDPVPVVPLGSGEGIARTLRSHGTKPDEPNPVEAAIFSASEIDTWTALSSRTGSTLTAELRKLYSAAAIGFANAGKDTRKVVAAHSYNACAIFNVQPLRSGPLLGAADGGLPQRIVWLPTSDPDAPDDPPEAPEPGPMDTPFFYSQEIPERVKFHKSQGMHNRLTKIDDIARWWCSSPTRATGSPTRPSSPTAANHALTTPRKHPRS